MKCLMCYKDYEAKRSTSLYCSAKCRKQWNAKRNAKESDANSGTLRNANFVTDAGVTGGMSHDTLVEIDSACGDYDQPLPMPSHESLPPGVTHPTGQRTAATNEMSARRLKLRISSYNSLTWIDSPEYAETVYRLQTLTVSQLQEQGQTVPQWKVSA